ncbi:hypothetical protein KPH14_010629 [Odynerus spinipes]|uniref:Uncharacterized protein n=1 Tax=Odynerus spinipes TaxID=1348599 RepID=A0AAD9RUS6_9HYME|nr:hypothetical protein KPH14_010629 [Odynerus spinipes]
MGNDQLVDQQFIAIYDQCKTGFGLLNIKVLRLAVKWNLAPCERYLSSTLEDCHTYTKPRLLFAFFTEVLLVTSWCYLLPLLM